MILVGEMREMETISLAITAAEMGMLVFGTLHTNNAAKTIDRIIDAFPAEEQNMVRLSLSESLAGIVSQLLLPRADKPGRIAANEILLKTPGAAQHHPRRQHADARVDHPVGEGPGHAGDGRRALPVREGQEGHRPTTPT